MATAQYTVINMETAVPEVNENNLKEVQVKMEPLETIPEECAEMEIVVEKKVEPKSEDEGVLDMSTVSTISKCSEFKNGLYLEDDDDEEMSTDEIETDSAMESEDEERREECSSEEGLMIKAKRQAEANAELRRIHDNLEFNNYPWGYENAKLEDLNSSERAELLVDQLTSVKDQFFNCGHEEFDLLNLYMRKDMPVLYETKYTMPGSVVFTTGFFILYNEKTAIFELKYYLRAGERQIIVNNFYDFYKMFFATDMDTLKNDYGEYVLFENVVGSVRNDRLTGNWLVLYQVRDFYYHRFGVEGEPYRIVISPLQHGKIRKVMCTQLNDAQFHMRKLCNAVNLCLTSAVGLAYAELKPKCKGCRERTPYDHICRSYEFVKQVQRALSLQLEKQLKEDKEHFQSDIYEKLIKFNDKNYPFKNMLAQALFDHGVFSPNKPMEKIPHWITSANPPTLEYIQEMYPNEDIVVCDCGLAH